MMEKTNTAAAMEPIPRSRSRESSRTAAVSFGRGWRVMGHALVGLRPLEQFASIDGADVQMQARAAADRGQRYPGTRRADRPQPAIEIGQGGDTVVRHVTDEIAFADVGQMRRAAF